MKVFVALVIVAAGCKPTGDRSATPTPSASTSSTDGAAAAGLSADCASRRDAKAHIGLHVPSYLAIPGDGAGHYCLGDAPKQMGFPCERTGARLVCRDFGGALELWYDDDKLTQVRLHRPGRVAPPSFARGAGPLPRGGYHTEEGVRPGMALSDALARLGSNQEVRSAVDPDYGNVTQYVFSGLVVEAEQDQGHDVVGALVVRSKSSPR